MASNQPMLQVIEGGRAQDARATLRDLYERYFASVYGRCLYLLKDRT